MSSKRLTFCILLVVLATLLVASCANPAEEAVVAGYVQDQLEENPDEVGAFLADHPEVLDAALANPTVEKMVADRMKAGGASPTATREPAQSQEMTEQESEEPIEIGNNDSKPVPGRWTCVGDFFVNEEKFFDDDATTGSVVYLREGAEVSTAENTTANCFPGDITVDAEAQQYDSGCEGGCAYVDVVSWPEGMIPSATPTVVSAPTATRMPSTDSATSEELVLHESEGGIPYNGVSITLDVAPDEIEVITTGPATIAGASLPGGINRGSVILLLPSTSVVQYTVDNLVTGANWHGSYRPLNPSSEETQMSIAQKHIDLMMQAPNCTHGEGCQFVDVVVVGPGPRVIERWAAERK